jgi:hypothetical protein
LKRWLLALLLGVIAPAWAEETATLFREWSKIDVTGPFTQEFPNLRYEAFIESRNQETRLDGAVGWRLLPLVSVWSGYTWISPNDGGAQIYRPWQQVIWELLDKNPVLLFQTRTRLEELKQQGRPEWLLRLRERWRLAFPNRIAGRFTPVISDEIFLNFNQPGWTSPGFFDQNRFFIGIDTPVWKKTFVELGYLNQYRLTQPTPTLAHVLLVSFMITI